MCECVNISVGKPATLLVVCADEHKYQDNVYHY